MTIFHYRALDGAGNKYTSFLEAKNSTDLYKTLNKKGHYLLNYRRKRKWLFKKNVSQQELIDFCTHMYHMDKVGVPLLDALEDLKKISLSDQMRSIISDLYNQVKSGSLLSDALKHHQSVFSILFINILEMCEKTGKLHMGFKKLQQHLIWVKRTQSEIRKSLRYPVLLIAIMITIVGLMTSFLLPRIIDFLELYDNDLSPLTRALITCSQIVIDWGAVFLLILVGILISISIMKTWSRRFAGYWHRVILSLPILGKIILKMELAQYLQNFAILFATNLDVISCLKFASRTTRNVYLQDKFNLITQSVSAGESLSKAFAQQGYFPRPLINMIKIGEKTGNLTHLMEHLQEFYNEDIKYQIEKIISLIEPTLVMIAGGLMIWIVMAILYPIYEQVGLLQ